MYADLIQHSSNKQDLIRSLIVNYEDEGMIGVEWLHIITDHTGLVKAKSCNRCSASTGLIAFNECLMQRSTDVSAAITWQ